MARLESVQSSGLPLFVLTTSGGEETLLLPRDNRIVQRERAGVLAEAVLGIPLTALELEGFLTGCPRINGSMETRTFGDAWVKLRIDDDELYYQRHRSADPWRLAVMIRTVPNRELRWRVEYRNRREGIPRTIRLASVEWTGQVGRSFDVELSLSQIQINPSLGPDTFRVRVPPAVELTTLEQLRRAGLLGPGPLLLDPKP